MGQLVTEEIICKDLDRDGILHPIQGSPFSSNQIVVERHNLVPKMGFTFTNLVAVNQLSDRQLRARGSLLLRLNCKGRMDRTKTK